VSYVQIALHRATMSFRRRFPLALAFTGVVATVGWSGFLAYLAFVLLKRAI